MKVKYTGDVSLRFHNIDFKKGDVVEVANDLEFPKEVFEVMKDEKKSEVDSSKKSK